MITIEKTTDWIWEADPMYDMLLPLCKDVIKNRWEWDDIVGRMTDRLCESLKKDGYVLGDNNNRVNLHNAKEMQEKLLAELELEIKEYTIVEQKELDLIASVRRELKTFDGFDVELSVSNSEEHLKHNYFLIDRTDKEK